MAPLDTFMRLHATNSILVLLEYAFALCEPGAWPFPSTMDINILPEACLAYNTPADSENLPEDPTNTDLDSNAGTGKKHCRCKGKSKNWSKSAVAASSASETSPGHKNQTPHIKAALVTQVAQDLHLSSDGADSENPKETNKDTPATSDSQPLAGPTRPESGADPPGTSAPELTTPTMPPEKDVDVEKTVDPPQPGTPVLKPVMPDSTEGMESQSVATPTAPAADTMSTPVATEVTVPPGFRQQLATPNSSLVPPVPSGVIPDKDADLQAQMADRSMTYLAQSLAMAHAGGNPDTGAFSSVMTGLRKACGLMSEELRQACLDVEVVVQKTLAEAMAHDRAFTTKATKDLDLWTSALQLLFDTDEIMEADMETRRGHAQHTGQVVSD